MRFTYPHTRQTGAGIGGIFRPLFNFFRSFIFPSAAKAAKSIAPLAKRAFNSKVGKKSTQALKEASIGLVADAISGKSDRESANTHINKAREKVANALLKSQSPIKTQTTLKRKNLQYRPPKPHSKKLKPFF